MSWLAIDIGGANLKISNGADFADSRPFALWKEPERLVKMCRLVTIKRPGYEMPGVIELEKLIPGLSDSLIVLDKPEMDISATDIRMRVTEGLPIGDLVPAVVEEYIRENGLYKEEIIY